MQIVMFNIACNCMYFPIYSPYQAVKQGRCVSRTLTASLVWGSGLLIFFCSLQNFCQPASRGSKRRPGVCCRTGSFRPGSLPPGLHQITHSTPPAQPSHFSPAAGRRDVRAGHGVDLPLDPPGPARPALLADLKRPSPAWPAARYPTPPYRPPSPQPGSTGAVSFIPARFGPSRPDLARVEIISKLPSAQTLRKHCANTAQT